MPPVNRLAALLLFALAACAGPTAWEKDGAPREAMAQDLAQCRAEASRAVDRDTAIDQDILSGRSQDLQRSGMLELRRDTMRNSNRGRYDDLVAGCMSARGYHAGGA